MPHSSDLKQKEHYNNIAGQYELHYGDFYSSLYREEFIIKPLFDGIDLSGKKILDAMCGTGIITEHLLQHDCRIESFDLSESQIKISKEKFPQCNYTVGTVLEMPYSDETFDVVVLHGGLHHVHPNVKAAVSEVVRVLKPGGYFINGEIHADSIIDRMRNLWYRHDPLFEDNEMSIDFDRLEADFKKDLERISISYFGNIAYYLVINSMILRIPFFIKRIISNPLLFIERIITPYQTRYFSSYAITQWRKKES